MWLGTSHISFLISGSFSKCHYSLNSAWIPLKFKIWLSEYSTLMLATTRALILRAWKSFFHHPNLKFSLKWSTFLNSNNHEFYICEHQAIIFRQPDFKFQRNPCKIECVMTFWKWAQNKKGNVAYAKSREKDNNLIEDLDHLRYCTSLIENMLSRN